MQTKKCNECFVVKNVSEFGKESRAVNGYKPRCKNCLNKYYNLKYKSGAINKKEKSKEYYQKNKNRVLKVVKKYYTKNRNKIILRQKFYLRAKKISHPHIRTIASFRSLIKKMLRDPSYSTFKYLQYSFDDLIKTLGRLPEKGEHIDHKIPMSWFIDETELRLIFSLSNLQILTATENISKGNRYCHSVSTEYFNLIKPFIKPKYIKQIKHG